MTLLRNIALPMSMALALANPTTCFAEPQEQKWDDAPVILTASEDVTKDQQESEQDDDTRVYVDLYGFLPWNTTTNITVDGNQAPTASQGLRDVLTPTTGAFTGRAGIEFGRFGFQLGVNHGSSYTSETAYSWKESNPIRNSEKYSDQFPNLIKNRRVKSEGSIGVDNTFNQTIVDLALRYRGGAIPSPRMDSGDFAFIGLAGARIVDASMDVDVNFSNKVTFDGVLLDKHLRREFNQSASQTIANTWVSPLIGMNAIYAFNDRWQAFVYLDAAGFGVSGQQDMSGTAQAGIAYTIGNSTQLSLAYKYWGIDYAGNGTDNSYSVTQSGLNLGLRLFFD